MAEGLVTAGPAPRLVLLPGMGADARMFRALARRLPGLVVPRWIVPHADEPLADYAVRLADAAGMRPTDIVGGSSFGGMLALEIARRRGARAVVQIGSAIAPDEVAPWLLRMAPLEPLVPDRALAGGAWVDPLVAPMLGLRRRADCRLLRAMARDTGPGFLRWAIHAVRGWTGCRDPGCALHRLHGSRDRIFPTARVIGATLVRGAGHGLAMTHAATVAALLRRRGLVDRRADAGA